MRYLKTGDPCPCCGMPIRWKTPRILKLLTYAATGEITSLGLKEMLELMDQEKGESYDQKPEETAQD